MYPALVITLRESLEASLLVGVVLALVSQEGLGQLRRMIWLGVGIAVITSGLFGAAIIATVGSLHGRAQEAVEGLLEWSAAGILTYVLWWMSKRSREVSQSVRAEAAGLLGVGSGWALFALVFLTVFREGAESALYLGAASANSTAGSIATGAGSGVAAGVAAGWAFYRGGTRVLDLRLFFRVTTAVLFVFGTGLVGHATLALQAAHLFPGTLPVWNSGHLLSETSALGGALSALAGYTARPSALQLTFMGGYIAFVASLYRRPRTGRSLPIGESYDTLAYRVIRNPRFTRWLAVTMGVVLTAVLVVGFAQLPVGPFDNHGWVRLGHFITQGDDNNLLEFVMWIVWLPLLSLGTLLLGRLWCGNLCPLRIYTDAVRSLADRLHLGRGAATRRAFRMGWILPSSFILVTFVVKGGTLQNEARLGAIFFMAIFIVAGVVSFIFRRGTWCRYLCPIGGWLARIARLSPLALRPDPTACARCPDKPCITGTSRAGRCPMALNPSRLATSRDCLTCWNCVTNCPDERASLKLAWRAPGSELWGPTQPNLWESLFVASLIGMYMSVGQRSVVLSNMAWPFRFFGLIVVTTAAYLFACAIAAPVAGVSWRHALSNFGYALLPLEFGTAIIAMGDDALEFLKIMQPAAIALLAIGFAWSVYLGVSILRNHSRTPLRAIVAAVPLYLLLVSVLFVWLHWYATGTVVDLS